jgi:tRNA threonylcarbamoyladenosine biosynthesis protein TsaE
MEILCKSIDKTKKIAEAFCKCIKENGAFVTLCGEIGVGKTTFTKFLLKALGVVENVTSPTFVILNEYYGENHIPVYHFDLYRLEREAAQSMYKELAEYSKGDFLTLVEWANFAKDKMPRERIEIEISYTNNVGMDERLFKFNGIGEKMMKLIENMQKECEHR